MKTYTFELMNGDHLSVEALDIQQDPENPDQFHLYRKASEDTALRFGVVFARKQVLPDKNSGDVVR